MMCCSWDNLYHLTAPKSTLIWEKSPQFWCEESWCINITEELQVELYQPRKMTQRGTHFPSSHRSSIASVRDTVDYGKLGWFTGSFSAGNWSVPHWFHGGTPWYTSNHPKGSFLSARWGLASAMLTVCRDGIPIHPNEGHTNFCEQAQMTNKHKIWKTFVLTAEASTGAYVYQPMNLFLRITVYPIQLLHFLTCC